MIPIEQQVVSLELAKRLKELGVRQESYFYWLFDKARNDSRLITKDSPYHAVTGDIYSAFTVAELGKILPWELRINGKQYFLTLTKAAEKWVIKYATLNNEDVLVYKIDTNISNIMAFILIYLIENGYVKAGEL